MDVHRKPGESVSVVLEASAHMVEYTEGIQVRQVVERHSSSRRAVDRPGRDSLTQLRRPTKCPGEAYRLGVERLFWTFAPWYVDVQPAKNLKERPPSDQAPRTCLRSMLVGIDKGDGISRERLLRAPMQTLSGCGNNLSSSSATDFRSIEVGLCVGFQWIPGRCQSSNCLLGDL